MNNVDLYGPLNTIVASATYLDLSSFKITDCNNQIIAFIQQDDTTVLINGIATPIAYALFDENQMLIGYVQTGTDPILRMIDPDGNELARITTGSTFACATAAWDISYCPGYALDARILPFIMSLNQLSAMTPAQACSSIGGIVGIAIGGAIGGGAALFMVGLALYFMIRECHQDVRIGTLH